MKTYKIYFEVYGHKMKTTVQANNERDAKEWIKDKIIKNTNFLKVTEEDKDLNFLKNIFGI